VKKNLTNWKKLFWGKVRHRKWLEEEKGKILRGLR